MSIIYTRELNTTSETGKVTEPRLKHKLERFKLDHTGFNDLVFYVEGAPAANVRAHVIPAWLSLLPPLATLAVAVTLKQVLLALLLGIWIGVYTWSQWRAMCLLYMHVHNVLIDLYMHCISSVN